MTPSHSHHRTPRGLALAPIIAVSALVALVPQRAIAQSESAECLAIVAQMLQPSPAPDAIRASAGCPVSGPTTLAERWTRRGARSATERAALVEASSLLRDSRIYDAVLAVTRDEGRPSADRVAGIKVMLDYAGNGYAVSQQGEAHGATPARASRQRSADTSIDGSVALTPGVRSDVKRELYRLANVDRDPDVRAAAQRGSESLGYVLPTKGKVAHYKMP
jgi:hypothetical protein